MIRPVFLNCNLKRLAQHSTYCRWQSSQVVLMDTLSTYLHSVLFYKQRLYKKLLKFSVDLRKKGRNCDFFLNLRDDYTKPHYWKNHTVPYKNLVPTEYRGTLINKLKNNWNINPKLLPIYLIDHPTTYVSLDFFQPSMPLLLSLSVYFV